MIRIALRLLLPVLAPFLAYFAWVWLMKRLGSERHWTHPWHWLSLAAVVCLLAVLGYAAVTDGGPAGSTYVPPSYENGRIVPGHYLPTAPKKE